MGISRRGFVGLCVGGAGALAFGGAVRAFGAPADVVRPPVVIDEASFMERCIRCYRCVSACPTKAIEPMRLEEGILGIKTPKMNFHRGYCDFCNACVEVCPTAALVACDPLDPSQGRMGYAEVDPERCLAFYNGCDECANACPYEAISLNDLGQPVINDARCNGCGVCVYVCPALVYRSYAGSDKRGIEIMPDETAKA